MIQIFISGRLCDLESGSRTIQTAIGIRERVWICEYKDTKTKSGHQAGAKKMENTVILFSGISYEIIIITNPDSGGDWRRDETHDIEWTSQNISSSARIVIYYRYNDGGTWRE